MVVDSATLDGTELDVKHDFDFVAFRNRRVYRYCPSSD
jgi:hypothetical protein